MDAIAVTLERLKREAQREWKLRKRADWRGLAGDAAVGLLKVGLVIILPFAVLVRGSVFIYEHGETPVWLALLVAAFLTAGVVTAYSVWLVKKLYRKGTRGTRALVLPVAKWVGVPLVLFYCGYSLLYIASVNAKSEPVREYYTSLHPLLRLSVSTLVLVDRDMLITDAGRLPEDYKRMGLPVNGRTRHYRQHDGWIHAIDLRTSGRGAIKNRGVQLYFWLMGFDTRRHVGTADHLHIELN
jgi:hypothetical protein